MFFLKLLLKIRLYEALYSACIGFYILTRDIDIANLSVRLSVRNVPVSDENGLTYRIVFFSPYGTSVAQSFCFHQHQTYSRNSNGVIPAGALNAGGV